MSEIVEEKVGSPQEHYREANAALNRRIQEFNGPGEGKEGDSPATAPDPALQQGYPVPLEPKKVPGKEMPGAADKPKRREGEVTE